MGQHVWLLLATIGTELLAIVKWSKGQFPAPLPTQVRLACSIGAALLVLYPISQVSVHVMSLYSSAYSERLIDCLIPLVVWCTQRSQIS
jgi:phosphatidylserine synthase 2